MLKMPKLNLRSIGLLLVFLAAFSAIPFLAGTYGTSIAVIILSFVALVAAWQIISGYTGYILLGSAAFYGLGMYVSAIIAPIMTLYAAIPIAAAVCFIAALGLGVPFLRIKGPYFIIATLALGELLRNLITFIESNYFRTLGRITVFYDVTTIFYLMLVNAAAALLVTFFIKQSNFGLGLLSIKNDEVAAESCGIPTTKYKSLAFGITAALMGSTGAIIASRGGYVDPNIAFATYISIYTLVMGVLGVMGSLVGGTISAIILSILFELFLSVGNPYPFGVMLGILVIISVVFRGRRFLREIFKIQKLGTTVKSK